MGTMVSIFVSQALGRKNREEANGYFHAVLRMCLIISVILMAGLAIFAEPLMRLFSRQQETMEALKKEGIQKVFGLVFADNEAGNLFWEKQGDSLRTNLNYRNKSLNEKIPTGK
ncbi:MAG: hypothetical protein IJ231_07445 [Clostridia bacterium]|nr:hypothetical protein [Clostridia bacterium]